MTRIDTTFKSLSRPALVTFITAGDPDYETSLAVMKTLPGAGADIIELGMPFTDPMADGPVIEAAGHRALQAGADMGQTLRMIREFRETDQKTPIVLMGYTNPLFIYGFDRFVTDAVHAGADGLILVDLPPEEDGELRAACAKEGLALIRLITPTTDEKRLKTLLQGAGGFLYYVSITGVTGAASADLSAIKPHIAAIKAQTNLPVAIGFGIKTPDDAAKFAEIGDAVVVGSAIVQNMAEGKDTEKITQAIEKQVKFLKKALG